MPLGSHDQPLIGTTSEVPVLGSGGWKMLGVALSCFSWGGWAEDSGGQTIWSQCAKWGCSAGLEYTEAGDWQETIFLPFLKNQSYVLLEELIY